MPAGKLPGMSYEDMRELIRRSRKPATNMFSIELLTAIFWEESLFNNIKQEGGSAWGFGQVEPAEYYKVECPRPGARSPGDPRTNKPCELGYEVSGIPPRQKMGTTTVLLGELTPEQSVQISSGLLRHLLEATRSKQNALYAYAGVGYRGTDVPAHLDSAAKRIKIVNDWLACATHLQGTPNVDEDWPTFIKRGLMKARPFNLDDREFTDKLFPGYSTGQWTPGVAGWLVDYMKTIP